jgi:superfamily I DNA/RNA helicase
VQEGIQNPMEEERRLFYVGVTRAREELIIYTWNAAKSKFIVEINSHIIEKTVNTET